MSQLFSQSWLTSCPLRYKRLGQCIEAKNMKTMLVATRMTPTTDMNSSLERMLAYQCTCMIATKAMQIPDIIVGMRMIMTGSIVVATLCPNSSFATVDILPECQRLEPVARACCPAAAPLSPRNLALPAVQPHLPPSFATSATRQLRSQNPDAQPVPPTFLASHCSAGPSLRTPGLDVAPGSSGSTFRTPPVRSRL
eukprot:CAMPEP_0173423716 /NCGR_PEP_ID=MMETSP1357-20121228/3908_1 /TAXON_ID=77926 /ORGANISM="Hemiselmis rufescens, Strain PCC563" /LENGTH=195 /DNA_ID=CAMNT_0014386867 /DNA_START=90 /DNA_END=673 /DNA_ORIENTATION=-